jgi:NAD(P)-dependent dehydrogenase (short-subunit alcohol dehydrogenase family)
MNLNGRVALITGASRGIGRAIAKRLSKNGAAVGINYVSSAEAAEALAREMIAAGGRAIAVRANVSDALQVQAMTQKITEQFGPIDILVNNAGVLRRGDLADFDYSQMDEMRRTNVDGLVNVTRAVIGPMKQRMYGRIVNLTSIAAHGTAFTGTTFYAATKAAVSLLTRRFAMELGQFGITVNAIAPGLILTEMAAEGKTPDQLQAMIAQVSSRTMVQRVGMPDDIASAAAFLAAEESGFITGQVLTVDGGRMDYIHSS